MNTKDLTIVSKTAIERINKEIAAAQVALYRARDLANALLGEEKAPPAVKPKRARKERSPADEQQAEAARKAQTIQDAQATEGRVAKAEVAPIATVGLFDGKKAVVTKEPLATLPSATQLAQPKASSKPFMPSKLPGVA